MNLDRQTQLSVLMGLDQERELQGIIAVSRYLLNNKDDDSKQQIGWDYLRFRISHLLSLKTIDD